MVEALDKVLMERDGITQEEANERISEAKDLLAEYLEAGDLESAMEICEEEFGLEPDYIMDMIY